MALTVTVLLMESKAFLKSTKVTVSGSWYSWKPSIILLSIWICCAQLRPGLKPAWFFLRIGSTCGRILSDRIGPLSIKSEFQEAEKAYACLFTSCATGAVHLELTRSMTTKRFFYWLWQGWCRKEAWLTWFRRTILDRLKTLTKLRQFWEVISSDIT